MMTRTLFPRDLFADFAQIQRELHTLFDNAPGIRGVGRGGYPALNVGTTPTSVEVYAFAPGLDPAAIEVNLDRGVLSIAGERPAPKSDDKATCHLDERFAGRFRRVVSLPDDVDTAAVDASYRDGVLRISIPRRAAAQPRRVNVQ